MNLKLFMGTGKYYSFLNVISVLFFRIIHSRDDKPGEIQLMWRTISKPSSNITENCQKVHHFEMDH